MCGTSSARLLHPGMICCAVDAHAKRPQQPDQGSDRHRLGDAAEVWPATPVSSWPPTRRLLKTGVVD